MSTITPTNRTAGTIPNKDTIALIALAGRWTLLPELELTKPFIPIIRPTPPTANPIPIEISPVLRNLITVIFCY